MQDSAKRQTISTRIWQEEAEADNSFATRAAYCHGYDVFSDMLGRARWVDMLFLLFRGEAPTPEQAALLEALAVALANPGPRDPAVHAAMCAGTSGATAAASLMAALAVGAGQVTGAREVMLAVRTWESCGRDLDSWRHLLRTPAQDVAGIWPDSEHPAGFDLHGTTTTTPVRQALSCLARLSPGPCLRWLEEHRAALEDMATMPLAMTGVAAAAFVDLGMTHAQAEMLHLLMRLPGAAAHALEQREKGHRSFPFFELDLLNDPAREAA
ncbi:citrate synthase family protein [Piscinibacter terrae]|uniref:Citryl-CoA lyase n=1 Tax=Piscinibacter terrae TaxID=2496871 RepID=A0A3N7HV35_9BURK|nr:citryl-CoA lyase [Albitalea terrae]RQP24821.1 citryl-CoA lyase [Albitalea terrae]